MIVREIVQRFLELLESRGVDYVLVGGIAAMHYGIPRFTKGADFVVAAPPSEIDHLLSDLPPGFVVEPQARMELFTGTMRWVISIENTHYKVEIFILGSDAHHAAEFERRRRVWLPLVERELWTASAEDIIIQKLRWARPHDLADVRDILSVQGEGLDKAYLERWCREHGTLERLEEIRRSIPEI